MQDMSLFLADIWGLSAFVKASKQSVPSKVCTNFLMFHCFPLSAPDLLGLDYSKPVTAIIEFC